MTIFSRVAEAQSFTQAATTLRLPKARVSMAVKQLEDQFGVQLLHRTTRQVRLTQDGAALYGRARDLIEDFDELTCMFLEKPEGLSGRIRVDMPSRLARYRVLPRLPEFCEMYPGITVELGATDRFVDIVREGYDCVVRAGVLHDSALVARPIATLEIVNCASPAYIEKYGRPRRLKDLDRHRAVHFVSTLGQQPFGWEYPTKSGGYRTFAMEGTIEVNNADAFVAACLAGLGLIQTPLIGVEHLLEEGALVEVLPKHRAEAMPLSLVFPHRRNLSQRVRVFMDWLASILASPRPA